MRTKFIEQIPNIFHCGNYVFLIAETTLCKIPDLNFTNLVVPSLQKGTQINCCSQLFQIA